MEPLTGREKALIGVTLATVLVATAILLVASFRIQNVGRIKTIGLEVYVDEDLSELADYIDWGVFEPGQQKSVRTYVFNPKTAAFTVSCNTSDWVPAEIGQYMSFFFVCRDAGNSSIVDPGEVARLDLRLQVSANLPEGFEDFTFDIWVTATEYLED